MDRRGRRVDRRQCGLSPRARPPGPPSKSGRPAGQPGSHGRPERRLHDRRRHARAASGRRPPRAARLRGASQTRPRGGRGADRRRRPHRRRHPGHSRRIAAGGRFVARNAAADEQRFTRLASGLPAATWGGACSVRRETREPAGLVRRALRPLRLGRRRVRLPAPSWRASPSGRSHVQPRSTSRTTTRSRPSSAAVSRQAPAWPCSPRSTAPTPCCSALGVDPQTRTGTSACVPAPRIGSGMPTGPEPSRHSSPTAASGCFRRLGTAGPTTGGSRAGSRGRTRPDGPRSRPGGGCP